MKGELNNEENPNPRRCFMKKSEDKKISDGLNEIFEIINAKGDIGELEEIVETYTQESTESKTK